jgi:hypothetical protein
MLFPPFSHPIIIIGSHRSGTSWVSKSLADAGVQMGAERDHNEEAWHFLNLNQQAMENASGSWDMPLVPQERHWPIHRIEDLMKSHFGFHRRRDLWQLWVRGAQWGWKDPRNTFTLSHWLKLFPNARILHVYREGEEVAESLLRRQKKEGEVKSSILTTKDSALHLWKVYVDEARKYSSSKMYLEVNYQDLRQKKKEVLIQLDEFCKSPLSLHLSKNLM